MNMSKVDDVGVGGRSTYKTERQSVKILEMGSVGKKWSV